MDNSRLFIFFLLGLITLFVVIILSITADPAVGAVYEAEGRVIRHLLTGGQ